MRPAQNRGGEVVARVIEGVWNSGRVDDLDLLLAAGYVRHGRDSSTSADAVKESVLLTRRAFPDLHTTIRHLVCDGDLVATHWRSVGTHRGDFHDLPVTGRTVEITGMTFSRLSGDRIAEEWESWDHRDLFASLGVVNLWEA
ncbi:ester cyclase [Mycobacterium sp. NAZ190054]|uniref:ester cyclase n=1 Tax=Mycobacterium sp. NAZ190054 TaxID=1747766 RepID=UPI00079AE770|nr:ester cyclase [Mycobacterium sp. NAZ190054]KWX68316.1 hypothetical protein ASJ79_18240 [Mycobacterium sp. NAZ190054]